MADIDISTKLELFEKMIMIRSFEQKVINLAERGIAIGSIHPCIGEEAIAVGTIMAIDDGDYIFPNHRGHGQELAKGIIPEKLMAEMTGKQTGICKGRVGSMHIFDREKSILGSQGVLGATIPMAVGVGLAIKLKEIPNRLSLCFFGDGTSNMGVFYESLNCSALWKVPVIFVVINNIYSMGTPYSKTCNVDIYKKSELFEISSETIDGNDVEEVYRVMKKVVKKVKRESRPALVEMKTYRIWGHSIFDKHPYRSKEEVEKWKVKGPIINMEKKLLKNGVNKKKIEEIIDRVNRKINEVEEFALNSDYPVYEDTMEQ